MIFSFYKYIKPIYYFNLKPEKDFGYFQTIQQLSDSTFNFKLDLTYKSEVAKERDLAWTLFQQGYIHLNYQQGLNIWEKVNIPLFDEYVFIRKNFHVAWVYYILLVRIITFKNPLIEFNNFIKTKGVKRVNYSKNKHIYADYENYKSKLVLEKQFISVIIPTLNRYKYLNRVIKDLENQNHKNFEIIVVDQSDDFDESFYSNRNLNIHFWYQKEKALWKARNEAIKFCKGDYILLYDDDSIIENNWIEEHLKAIDYFKAEISSGVSISTVGDEVPENYSYFKWSDQLDTGNVLIKKEVFEKIGLFDTQFEKQRMGDAEFGLRAYLAGFKNISNYKAKRIHLKVSQGGLRQMGSWDGWRPKKLFGPRPVPSVLYLSRKYYGRTLSIYFIAQSILPSLIPYRFKKSKFLKSLSFLLIPIVFPLICYQILKSWWLASKKIKEGSKIKNLF